MHSVAAFLPLLRAAPTKKIVVISTHGAVPAVVYNVEIANMCAYGTTKAAGALATAKWALQLKGEGFTVVSLTPGLVDTTDTIGPTGELFSLFLSRERVVGKRLTRKRTGDPEGKEILRKIAEGTTAFVLETPEQSVRAQLQVIDRLTPADNGAFLDHHGAQ